MKALSKTLCAGIIGFSLILAVPLAAWGQKKTETTEPPQDPSPTTVQPVKKEPEKNRTKSKKPKVTSGFPIYKPPLRGAPAGRVAGGTRGAGQAFPYLCLIVPEHVGLTSSRQPVLYFYQSGPSPYPVEFTLIQKQGIRPLVETRITPPQKPGLHAVRLSDYKVRLEPGIQYKWFIALVPDSEHRSRDILAAGGIEFIETPEELREKLAKADPEQLPFIYAESGLWYDAFHAMSDLVEKSPGEKGLRNQRASLLEQVGLTQVAETEADH